MNATSAESCTTKEKSVETKEEYPVNLLRPRNKYDSLVTALRQSYNIEQYVTCSAELARHN